VICSDAGRAKDAAACMGVKADMPVAKAAQLMLNVRPPMREPARRQIVVHDSENGRVFALDTVKCADARIEGGVLCMGSHSASSMPKYPDDVGVTLAGVITNDGGGAKDGSGIAGLKTLDDASIAAAVASCDTARVGDAQSTYFSGVISACNRTAGAMGVAVGQRATEAAAKMLAGRSRRLESRKVR